MIPSHLLQIKLQRFKKRSGLKNIKIMAEAAFANEEAVAKFLTELKKLIRVSVLPVRT